MGWNLFIDDERDFEQVTWAPPFVWKKYLNERWTIARKWEDVAYYISIKGFPSFISFDHDLGEGEKTGYEIAKLLIDYVMDGQYKFPENFDYYVHSKNPIGKQNIESYLNNYLQKEG